MDELALNILDIAYNSIRAHASLIEIDIFDSQIKNKIQIIIQDDGDGMSEETLLHVTDPFFTTRVTRNVGLGIPLFKQNAELTGGYLNIDSSLNKGTRVDTVFVKNHIDTPIMGNLEETLVTLIQANDNIDYIFHYKNDDVDFLVKTREMKEILGEVKINEPEVLVWLKEYIKEGLDQ